MEEKKSNLVVLKEGSLGLLATGYVGLVAWRKVRRDQHSSTEIKEHES